MPVSCCPAGQDERHPEQTRFEVAVGGTVWYVTPLVHAVQETHSVSDEPEQPPLAYDPDAQEEHSRQADCDTNCPLGQDGQQVPLSCSTLLTGQDEHCVLAGPTQLRHEASQGWHATPVL